MTNYRVASITVSQGKDAQREAIRQERLAGIFDGNLHIARCPIVRAMAKISIDPSTT